MSERWWQRPEGGGRVGLWLIFTLARCCGRPLTRLILYPVTLYFYVRRGQERRAARVLLARLGHRSGTWAAMAHMHRYASTLLDRVFFLAHGARGFDIDAQGIDMLQEVFARGRGVLLVGAHMGSFEVLRTLALNAPDAPPLRIVLAKQQTPVMTGLLASLAPQVSADIIDASGDPVSVVLALSESLQQGHQVALLGDRGHPGESMRPVPFCGRPAPFPVGPWTLAGALGVPVVLCQGLYLGGNRYRVVFELFADRVELPRKQRGPALDALMTRYAARLEYFARQAPCNWFNFYDFWDEDADDGAGDGGRGL